MRKLGLFYFSGTGNTKLVAGHIEEEFARMGWDVALYNIENITSKAELPDLDHFDLIGFGAQVIGYTTPRRMNRFIQLLPDSQKGTRVFIFRTCGGVTKTNYTASHSMIRMLRKRNYDVFYERLFSIGSNWVFKFDNTIMQQLYEATKRKIKVMCQEIVDGKLRFYETSAGFRIKKRIISGQSKIFFSMLGKNMKVSGDCLRCGKCVRSCPSDNIRLDGDQVKFGMNCSACLRCVYDCPAKAIEFRLLKFIPLKNGYDVKKCLFPDHSSEEQTNGRIPPFFVQYLIDDTM